MDALSAARAQMEVSLGFHMIFSAIGVALPGLMCLAEGLSLYRGPADTTYLELARRWGKATSLLFAVGAVSGTALSFELGLLWPRFMERAGATVGSAFTLEGYAFFLEAICIGLYLYGWDRLSRRAHFLAGVGVTVSGTASAVLVCAANAWMQVPSGDDPGAPFRSPVWLPMALHTTIASYLALGIAVAGVYAAAALRAKAPSPLHAKGIRLGMWVAAVAAALQLVSGDQSARAVAAHEPVKLAAMEAHFKTESHVPLVAFGIVDAERHDVRYALKIPDGLSLLVAHDPDAWVVGLDDAAPPRDWPAIGVVHVAFDVMVGCGMTLLALATVYAAWALRTRKIRDAIPPRLLLRAIVVASPLGFLAIEAGWLVAEAGRQPWTIRGVLRTADAVTTAGGVPATFFAFSILYLALGATLIVLLRRLAARDHEGAHAHG